MRLTKSELDDILKKNKHVTVDEEFRTCKGKELTIDTFRGLVSKLNPKILYFTVPGIPIPAPRQTQRDKWMKRPCVMRYREYGDRLRSFINLHDMYVGKITAKYYLPMPNSWSEKRRQIMAGRPHRVKPDGDNLIKATQDALLKNDSMIWACYYEKRWCSKGQERTELTFETTE